jgi:hypothetical protein
MTLFQEDQLHRRAAFHPAGFQSNFGWIKRFS